MSAADECSSFYECVDAETLDAIAVEAQHCFPNLVEVGTEADVDEVGANEKWLEIIQESLVEIGKGFKAYGVGTVPRDAFFEVGPESPVRNMCLLYIDQWKLQGSAPSSQVQWENFFAKCASMLVKADKLHKVRVVLFTKKDLATPSSSHGSDDDDLKTMFEKSNAAKKVISLGAVVVQPTGARQSVPSSNAHIVVHLDETTPMTQKFLTIQHHIGDDVLVHLSYTRPSSDVWMPRGAGPIPPQLKMISYRAFPTNFVDFHVTATFLEESYARSEWMDPRDFQVGPGVDRMTLDQAAVPVDVTQPGEGKSADGALALVPTEPSEAPEAVGNEKKRTRSAADEVTAVGAARTAVELWGNVHQHYTTVRSMHAAPVVPAATAAWYRPGRYHAPTEAAVCDATGLSPALYAELRDRVVGTFRLAPSTYFTKSDCVTALAVDLRVSMVLWDALVRWGLINHEVPRAPCAAVEEILARAGQLDGVTAVAPLPQGPVNGEQWTDRQTEELMRKVVQLDANWALVGEAVGKPPDACLAHFVSVQLRNGSAAAAAAPGGPRQDSTEHGQLLADANLITTLADTVETIPAKKATGATLPDTSRQDAVRREARDRLAHYVKRQIMAFTARGSK